MRTGFVKIGTQNLYYAESGPEDARYAILIFNGIGANVETAKTFMKQFENRRVIIFDVPGVGRSPTPMFPYRFSNMTRLAAGLLDHLGVVDVDVFGVSWGGGLAQQFAYDYPDRTNRLILAATTAGFAMVPGSLKVMSKMATPKRYTDRSYMAEIAPEIYGGLVRENKELLTEHMDAMSHSSVRGYVYQLMAISGWTSWPWLPQLKMPTLIMMGSDDPIIPPVNGRILHNRLPNSEIAEIECGHLFIITLPTETAILIEAFLLKTEVKSMPSPSNKAAASHA